MPPGLAWTSADPGGQSPRWLWPSADHTRSRPSVRTTDARPNGATAHQSCPRKDGEKHVRIIQPVGGEHLVTGDLGQKLAHFAPFLVSPVLLLVALLGAGWLYVPANPAIKAPATTLGFNDLHDLAASGAVPTTWLQQNYCG
ncbi:hypothetical protein GXW84_41350 [Rhodococcus sp. IEGM 248]|nr:hypothetical protein [Rhodococcus sp. IEGM 248]TQC42240.1 hypothetical protein EEB14_49975 [Rhodococcus sp. WS4]